jgi:hypothetical protein
LPSQQLCNFFLIKDNTPYLAVVYLKTKAIMLKKKIEQAVEDLTSSMPLAQMLTKEGGVWSGKSVMYGSNELGDYVCLVLLHDMYPIEVIIYDYGVDKCHADLFIHHERGRQHVVASSTAILQPSIFTAMVSGYSRALSQNQN